LPLLRGGESGRELQDRFTKSVNHFGREKNQKIETAYLKRAAQEYSALSIPHGSVVTQNKDGNEFRERIKKNYSNNDILAQEQ